MITIELSNNINLSLAELGVICNNLQSFGSTVASPDDVQKIVQSICDYVYNCIGSDFFDMWLDEFKISPCDDMSRQ